MLMIFQVLPLVPPDEGGSPYAGQVCDFFSIDSKFIVSITFFSDIIGNCLLLGCKLWEHIVDFSR